MDREVLRSLSEQFAGVDDPRVERTKVHRLLDIIGIALCAVLGGANSWDDIALFGETHHAWFATWLPLPYGIPSHDTFNRVFAALDPQQFEQAFTQWVQAVVGELPPQVIALDGKTVRGSRDTFHATPPLHLVSAWASTNQLVLTQIAVADKSNEITALPQVLAQLDIGHCLVTIDAMGCQRAIAQQIVTQGADYVLALKGNQPDLAEEVADCFAAAQEVAYEEVQHERATGRTKRHGRVERRRHTVITEPHHLAWLQEKHHWPGLAALGRIEAERRSGEDVTHEVRYYLLSRPLAVQEFAQTVRAHWGIENQVHWVLDVTFGEDFSRKRTGHAAENFAVLLRFALNLLRHAPAKKGQSLKGKRLRAGWDPSYLFTILAAFKMR
jgi:predicted transposase YbfD/YdcC